MRQEILNKMRYAYKNEEMSYKDDFIEDITELTSTSILGVVNSTVNVSESYLERVNSLIELYSWRELDLLTQPDGIDLLDIERYYKEISSILLNNIIARTYNFREEALTVLYGGKRRAKSKAEEVLF